MGPPQSCITSVISFRSISKTLSWYDPRMKGPAQLIASFLGLIALAGCGVKAAPQPPVIRIADLAERATYETDVRRLAAGINRLAAEAGQEGRHVGNLLVGQARSLGNHGRVLAHAIPVTPEGNLQVGRFLPAELRHAE